jgi:hypothetical protein
MQHKLTIADFSGSMNESRFRDLIGRGWVRAQMDLPSPDLSDDSGPVIDDRQLTVLCTRSASGKFAWYIIDTCTEWPGDDVLATYKGMRVGMGRNPDRFKCLVYRPDFRDNSPLTVARVMRLAGGWVTMLWRLEAARQDAMSRTVRRRHASESGV